MGRSGLIPASGGQALLFKSVLLLLLLLLSSGVLSYTTFGNGYGSKWDDPVFGTGATVSWSFMVTGVALPPDDSVGENDSDDPPPNAWDGNNSLGSNDGVYDIREKIDGVHGNGAFNAAVRRAFATWASVADLTFVQATDLGGMFAGDTTPDIRIGAFHFDPGDFAAGTGYGPPGDDLNFPDARAGDLALNDLNRFTIAPGQEGDPIPLDEENFVQNDLESLMLHEIGHTLGLGHSTEVDSVMCGYVSQAFDGSLCNYGFINRELHIDDIEGIQFIYGANPAFEIPFPALALWMLGLILILLVSYVSNTVKYGSLD